ncbi:MAG: hypothetical protein U9R08_03265 [Nanoarchaeota archaeon]|nr:hypothetical protein [Nanoarchaeota archaeon]
MSDIPLNEMYCPACKQRSDFKYIGTQKTRTEQIMLYNCSRKTCGTTVSFDSIMKQNMETNKNE